MLLGVVYLVLGILFALLSLFTWRLKWLGIIAGYDKRKVKDKSGLASWFGKCTLWLALASFALSFTSFYLDPFDDNTAIVLGISYMILTMIGSVITLTGMSRYYNF